MYTGKSIRYKDWINRMVISVTASLIFNSN